MSGTEPEVINIRASAKRNGFTTLMIGCFCLFLAATALTLLPGWFFLPGIFLTSASIVTVLVGWFKLREPEHSIAISPDYIVYHHRRGNWVIDWDNIQRFDCPRVRNGLEHAELEAVGIRLLQYAPFLRNVSPRLATHLLMEQRPLLMQEAGEDCKTGACFDTDLFDDRHFKLEDGEVLTGVKAMLANRMTQLRKRLGYDVYIPTSELDREPLAFVALLRQCQQTRQERKVAATTDE